MIVWWVLIFSLTNIWIGFFWNGIFCILVYDEVQLGKKLPDYWDASTKMLTDPTIFLDSLLNFDKENIPESVIQKIEPYIAMESFTPEQVQWKSFLGGVGAHIQYRWSIQESIFEAFKNYRLMGGVGWFLIFDYNKLWKGSKSVKGLHIHMHVGKSHALVLYGLQGGGTKACTACWGTRSTWPSHDRAKRCSSKTQRGSSCWTQNWQHI